MAGLCGGCTISQNLEESHPSYSCEDARTLGTCHWCDTFSGWQSFMVIVLLTITCLQANDFAGHNSSLFVLGVMILWFGW